MAKEVIAIIKSKKNIWKETHSVPDGVDAKKHIVKVVADFCEERGYDYTVQQIVRKRRNSSTSLQVHEWEKKSLVTERGGYDIMKCKLCGATGKRYGMGTSGVRVDKKYHTKYCNKKPTFNG